MDSLLEESGWRDLEAVKNGRCTFLSKDLFHYKPNARWAESYRVLAGLLYPESFHEDQEETGSDPVSLLFLAVLGLSGLALGSARFRWLR